MARAACPMLLRQVRLRASDNLMRTGTPKEQDARSRRAPKSVETAAGQLITTPVPYISSSLRLDCLAGFSYTSNICPNGQILDITTHTRLESAPDLYG
jgi:hypothetical protein